MNSRLELIEGGVYLSDNADRGNPPPFSTYVFYVMKVYTRSFDGSETPSRYAQILLLDSDDEHLYPITSIHQITPAYWIWSGAERIA